MPDDAYIGGRSENNIKCVVRDDLWWKNRTTRYILPRHWLYEWFSQFHRCGTYSVLSRSPSIEIFISAFLVNLTPPVLFTLLVGRRKRRVISRYSNDRGFWRRRFVVSSPTVKAGDLHKSKCVWVFSCYYVECVCKILNIACNLQLILQIWQTCNCKYDLVIIMFLICLISVLSC